MRTRLTGAALWARVAIVLGAVGLGVVPAPLHALPLVLTVVAGVATAIRPARVGALAPTIAFGIGWLAAGGWDAAPDPARTVVAAALLYLLHQATAFASVVPLDAAVDREVLQRWALRSVPAVAIAAVVVAVDLLVSQRSGSPAIEAVALVAVLVVVALVLRSVLLPTSGDS